jgi:hypothetical protein
LSTKFEIVTRAYLSIDAAPIQSFTGNTDEEIWAANNYEHLRRSELSGRPWNFATKYETLSRTVTTPTDKRWDYEYLPPSNDLRLLAVYDGDTGEQVAHEQAQDRIYANADSLYAKYIADLDTADLPPYFEDLLIARIAAEASEALSGEDRMIERKWVEYERKKREAVKIDAQSNPPRTLITEKNSNVLKARFRGGVNY